jgi:hypothetical protein
MLAQVHGSAVLSYCRLLQNNRFGEFVEKESYETSADY